MKFIKSFTESLLNPTLKDKLDSISDFYDYLCENEMYDSPNNYIGSCAALFSSSIEYIARWERKSGGKPFNLGVEKFMKDMEKWEKSNEWKFNHKIDQVEELYKTSQLPRFKYDKNDIEKMLSSVLNMTWVGEKVLKSYEIEQFYSGWDKKQNFMIKCRIEEDMLSSDESEILDIKNGNYERDEVADKSKLREVEIESYSIQKRIVDSIRKLDLPSSFVVSSYNNSHLDLFYEFSIKISIN